MNEYVIAFSSFYRAAYAQEKLQENRIRSTLQKVPPNILSSCGYAIYLKTNSIEHAINALERHDITARGVYLVENVNGRTQYRQIA